MPASEEINEYDGDSKPPTRPQPHVGTTGSAKLSGATRSSYDNHNSEYISGSSTQNQVQFSFHPEQRVFGADGQEPFGSNVAREAHGAALQDSIRYQNGFSSSSNGMADSNGSNDSSLYNGFSLRSTTAGSGSTRQLPHCHRMDANSNGTPDGMARSFDDNDRLYACDKKEDDDDHAENDRYGEKNGHNEEETDDYYDVEEEDRYRRYYSYDDEDGDEPYTSGNVGMESPVFRTRMTYHPNYSVTDYVREYLSEYGSVFEVLKGIGEHGNDNAKEDLTEGWEYTSTKMWNNKSFGHILRKERNGDYNTFEKQFNTFRHGLKKKLKDAGTARYDAFPEVRRRTPRLADLSPRNTTVSNGIESLYYTSLLQLSPRSRTNHIRDIKRDQMENQTKLQVAELKKELEKMKVEKAESLLLDATAQVMEGATATSLSFLGSQTPTRSVQHLPDFSYSHSGGSSGPTPGHRRHRHHGPSRQKFSPPNQTHSYGAPSPIREAASYPIRAQHGGRKRDSTPNKTTKQNMTSRLSPVQLKQPPMQREPQGIHSKRRHADMEFRNDVDVRSEWSDEDYDGPGPAKKRKPLVAGLMNDSASLSSSRAAGGGRAAGFSLGTAPATGSSNPCFGSTLPTSGGRVPSGGNTPIFSHGTAPAAALTNTSFGSAFPASGGHVPSGWNTPNFSFGTTPVTCSANPGFGQKLTSDAGDDAGPRNASFRRIHKDTGTAKHSFNSGHYTTLDVKDTGNVEAKTTENNCPNTPSPSRSGRSSHRGSNEEEDAGEDSGEDAGEGFKGA